MHNTLIVYCLISECYQFQFNQAVSVFIYITTKTTKSECHLFLLEIWCSICWLKCPVAEGGLPFHQHLLYEKGQRPADTPQAYCEWQLKLSLWGVKDGDGMVWRKHGGERRRRRRKKMRRKMPQQSAPCRWRHAAPLCKGVVMTSEKQREQPADSHRAETGWLQLQVRA